MMEVLEKPSVLHTAPAFEFYQRNISRLFFTALLIAGTVESAETAIEDSIDQTLREIVPSLRVAPVAVAAAAVTRAGSFDTHARLLLPEELRAVADLQPDLRLCFVLRSLLGLTACEAAQLIEMRPSEIDRCASSASIRLALRSLHAA
jgi:DNA-directed RNA polymerase specialized sigma24 family protein